MGHSKYYYDYTRNMSYEKHLEYIETHCGRDCCKEGKCCCAKESAKCDIGLDVWIEELEREEGKNCDINKDG